MCDDQARKMLPCEIYSLCISERRTLGSQNGMCFAQTACEVQQIAALHLVRGQEATTLRLKVEKLLSDRVTPHAETP